MTYYNNRLGLRFHRWVMLLLITVLTSVVSSYWVLNTTSGLQWLLSTVVRMNHDTLSVDGINGTFSNMQIDTLQYHDGTLQLTANQFQLNWSPSHLFTGQLLIHTINTQRIDVHIGTSPDETVEKTTVPDDLSLPVDLLLQTVAVDTLHFYDLDDGRSDQQPEFTITDLSIKLQSDVQRHRLTHFSFHSELGVFKASGHIETARPFMLKSAALLDNTAHWGITHAAASGTLEQLTVILTHQQAPMRAAATMHLQPFAPNPSTMLTSLHAVMIGLDLANFLADTPDLPKTNLALRTVIRQNNHNQLTGRLTLKNTAMAPLDQNSLPINDLTTAILLTEDTLQLDDLQIHLADKGSISGNMAWHLKQLTGAMQLNISHLNPAEIHSQLQPATINGQAQLTGDTGKQQITINLNDQALKLNASAIHTTNRLELEQFDLHHNQSVLTGKGVLHLNNDETVNGTQPFHFTGQLKQFNIADFIQGPVSNLNTLLDLSGQLSPEFSVTLDYQFEKSHLNHQPVTGIGKITLATPLSINSKAAFQIGSNHLNVHGQFGKPGDTLALQINAPSLAQIGFGLSGDFKARVDLKSTTDIPIFDFNIDARALALSEILAINSLSAHGHLHTKSLALTLKADTLRTHGKTQLQHVDLQLAGEKTAHTLQAHLQIDDDITAAFHADGSITGLDKPDTALSWQGRLTDLSITGPIPVKLQTPAPLYLSNDKITVDQLLMTAAGGTANIQNFLWTPQTWQSDGYFSGIQLHSGDDYTTKETVLQLGGKWRIESPTSLTQLNGDIEIAREIGDWYLPGDVPQPAGLQTLKLLASARDGILTGQFDLHSTRIGTVDAQLKLSTPHTQNNDPFSDLLPPGTQLDGQLNLKLPDLSWLGPLTNHTLETSGQTELQAGITGTLDKPVLQGHLHGNQLAVALLDLGLNLDQGELLARFDQSALHIDQLNFTSPYQPPPKNRLPRTLPREDRPGLLTVNGSLGFIDNAHHLDITLDRLHLVRPPYYWITASGNNTLQFVDNVLDLDGKITADSGLIVQPPTSQPQLADDIIIVDHDQPSHEESHNKRSKPIVNLHATLDLGKQFFLRVAGLEGRLEGNVQLSNDENGMLNTVGSIATQQATYRAYGQSLDVTRGIVNFHGSLDDPGLNILAIRSGQAVEAGVAVTGSVRHPKVQLVSTPQVPDTDKLSWIVLGRAPDTSGLDTSLLVAAVGAILGNDSGGITEQLSNKLGIDEISFRQSSTPGSTRTNTTNTHTFNTANTLAYPTTPYGSTLSGQIGTIGKRLSSRAYLSYERSITTTTAGITKLTYNLTPKIAVVTQAGEDNALDLFYTIRFD